MKRVVWKDAGSERVAWGAASGVPAREMPGADLRRKPCFGYCSSWGSSQQCVGCKTNTSAVLPRGGVTSEPTAANTFPIASAGIHPGRPPGSTWTHASTRAALSLGSNHFLHATAPSEYVWRRSVRPNPTQPSCTQQHLNQNHLIWCLYRWTALRRHVHTLALQRRRFPRLRNAQATGCMWLSTCSRKKRGLKRSATVFQNDNNIGEGTYQRMLWVHLPQGQKLVTSFNFKSWEAPGIGRKVKRVGSPRRPPRRPNRPADVLRPGVQLSHHFLQPRGFNPDFHAVLSVCVGLAVHFYPRLLFPHLCKTTGYRPLQDYRLQAQG